MRGYHFRKGVAFVLLMLSAAAMDSEELIIPVTGCFISVLLLLSDSKKKGPATDQSYRT